MSDRFLLLVFVFVVGIAGFLYDIYKLFGGYGIALGVNYSYFFVKAKNKYVNFLRQILLLIVLVSKLIVFVMLVKVIFYDGVGRTPSEVDINTPTAQNENWLFDLKYTLPAGWEVKEEVLTADFFEGSPKYSFVTFTRENYIITVGGLTTGTANCINDPGKPTYKELYNENLGSLVLRDIPNKPLSPNVEPGPDYQQVLTVCTSDSGDVPYTMSPFNLIRYYLPWEYDETILREMDEIVSSLQQ